MGWRIQDIQIKYCKEISTLKGLIWLIWTYQIVKAILTYIKIKRNAWKSKRSNWINYLKWLRGIKGKYLIICHITRNLIGIWYFQKCWSIWFN